MWFILMDVLRHPIRSVIGLVAAIVFVGVAVTAIAHGGPDIQGRLGVVLGALVLLVMVRIPVRLIIPLMVVAVAIAATASIGQIVPSGIAPLLLLFVVGALPVVGARRWWRAHVHRPRPRAHGAHWATMRELKRGGFL